MNNTLGNLIALKRKNAKLSQSDLAELLTNCGYPITNKGISSWEKDITIPNAYQYIELCRILDISNDNILDGLTIEGKYKAIDYINTLKMTKKYSTIIEVINNKRSLPVYNSHVSAGVGDYLYDEAYEMIEVGDEVPDIADYGLYIHGDSMSPRYVNNQIIWVKKIDILYDGNIGIFYLDGEVYCKVLQQNKLVSLNPAYHDIDITEANEFKILGKVVS